MIDIEKRARELLAAEYEKGQFRAYGPEIRSGSAGTTWDEEVRAIIAALTPPEGYVLIKADTLQDLATDAEEYVRSTEFRSDQIESKLDSVREAQSLLTPEAP